MGRVRLACHVAKDPLGLPWDEQVMQYRNRLSHKPVNSPTYEEVARPVHATSIGRWKHYAQYLQPYLRQLDPYIQRWASL